MIFSGFKVSENSYLEYLTDEEAYKRYGDRTKRMLITRDPKTKEIHQELVCRWTVHWDEE